MTNFSGTGRQEFWSWLTPERAVLVVPVFAGLGLSLAVLSIGITPLTLRVREQSKMVTQLTTKADLVPVLREQLAALKRKQSEREQQLDRLLDLVAGTSELQTFLAELNDIARLYNVEITTTKPGVSERFKASIPAQDQAPPPAAGGVGSQEAAGDPILNRGLEKRMSTLTVKGPFQNVLAFLQSLELLEVFVVISEMNIQEKSRQMENTDNHAEVNMDLTLSAYGRQSNYSVQSNLDEN